MILLTTLAQLGPEAKQALAPLSQKLDDPGKLPRCKEPWLLPPIQAALQLAVTSVRGETPHKSLKPMFSSFKAAQPGLDAFNYMFAIEPLSWIRPGKWLSEPMVAELGELLVGGARERGADRWIGVSHVAVILGVLEKRAGSAVEELETAQRVALESHSPGAIPITLALARVAPQRADETLQRLFKTFPAIMENMTVGASVLMLQDIPPLMNAELSKTMGRLLSDEDANVQEGAKQILSFANVSARPAVPVVLQIVRGTKPDDDRLGALDVLQAIAAFPDVSVIEQVLENEKSSTVSEKLRTVIRAIRELK